jgi:YVTN family beta-propeller protein
MIAALLFVVLCSPSTRSASLTSSPVKRNSSAMAITADGATLLVVNPDSNSLTLVDAASRSVIAELSVGIDPRTVTVDEVVGN